MRYLFLTLLTAMSTGLAAQIETWPTYREVVTHYFERYLDSEEAEEEEDWLLQFSRRPDGYYVEKSRYFQAPVALERLYDFSTHAYLELSDGFKRRPVSPEEQTAEIAQAVEAFLADKNYDIIEYGYTPFYGYKGYYRDVIAFYEQRDKKLTIWELHALGRAYSWSAAILLSPYFPYVDPADCFDPPPGRGLLSDAQVETYINTAEKALATYEKIIALDPDFVTPVGPITTKYANEVACTFLTLMYNQNETTARKVLRKGVYDPYMLQMGRNWLNSCLPNSVLFTYGDSDTYPLYYLQATENLRTDVIIVNLALVVLPNYLKMLYEGPFAAQPLKTKFPPRFFEKMMVAIKENADEESVPAPIEALYEVLADTSSYESDVLNPGQHYVEIPSSSYQMQVPPGIVGLDGKPVDIITLSSSSHYLFSDRLLLFDLLEANAWQRPVYFAPTVQMAQYSGVPDYLVLEGMLLRFYPRKIADGQAFAGTDLLQFPVNRVRSDQLWSKTYRFDTTQTITYLDKASYYQTALLCALRLLRELQAQGDKDRVHALGQFLIKHFPDNRSPWDQFLNAIAQVLAEAGDTATAEYIALKIYDNCVQNRFPNYSAEEVATIRESVCSLAETWDMKKVKRRCKKG